MTGDARFVSISEAARIVGEVEGKPITRSTLSRYITQWASALSPKREGRETLIDADLLLTHRAENVRIERADAAPYRSAGEAAASKTRKIDAEARSAEVRAIIDETNLARDRGELVERVVVVQAAQDAMAAMESALDKAEAEAVIEIARLARIEERRVKPVIRALRNTALHAFRSTLTQALAAPEVEPPRG